jgi:two-component system, NtrC family, nitrogen regulation response regulator NtrX
MKKGTPIVARILIVDDEQPIRRALKSVLDNEPYEVDEAVDGLDGIEQAKKKKYDVIFLDIRMPRMDGLEAIGKILEVSPDSSIIMISGHGDITTAVDSVRRGAFDYLQKPLDLNRVLITIRNALNRSSLIVETKALITETKVLRRKAQQSKVQEIIGQSELIQKVKAKIDMAAPVDARVLILGPNGTGKELVARWIHEKSARRDAPFVEVNCAAIPSELIESILFGAKKGAYTGAVQDMVGKFEQAHGGTLLLDEVGDMSLQAQAKILRALQENKVTRVGDTKDIPVDVRVIAATNKNLREEINKGLFREDLYNRLEVVDIYVPSLNDRKEDIPLLIEHFMKIICDEYGIAPKTFSIDALIALKNIDWTGNIRQLRNVIERLIIYCREKKEITDDDINEHVVARRGLHRYEMLFNRHDSLEDLLRYVASEYKKFKGQKV